MSNNRVFVESRIVPANKPHENRFVFRWTINPRLLNHTIMTNKAAYNVLYMKSQIQFATVILDCHITISFDIIFLAYLLGDSLTIRIIQSYPQSLTIQTTEVLFWASRVG